MSGTTLLTGATGFLGMELLARLVARDDDRPIVALVRASDHEEADARLAAVREAVFGDRHAHAERVRAVCADLERPGLGLSPAQREALAAEATEIVHGAASVSFTLPLDKARAVNVDGTRRVLDIALEASRRGVLRRMIHVSTAYVAGDRRGACAAHELDPHGPHRNTYERSKAEAEALVHGWRDQLSVTVVRPSIVVGHSRTGWTSSFNVLYGPLRAFAAGALPVIPGRREAPVDVVPVDYVAAGAVALLDAPGAEGRTLHLTAGSSTATVGEVCSLGAEHFRRPEPRVLPPALYRRAVYPVLVRTGDERRRRAVRGSEQYLPYFAARCTYDDGATRAELGPLGVPAPPPLAGYFDKLVDFAERARWGRDTVGRAAAAQLEAAARVPLPA